MTVTTCPSANKPGPNWQHDFLDFPTAWHLANQGLLHTDRRCSYTQTWGGLLCDCGAIQREWERRTGKALTVDAARADRMTPEA